MRRLSGLMVGALVGALVVAVLAGPAGPARAQGVALSTATVTPEDAVLYAAMTLDTASEQWATGETLLRRAGLGDILDQIVADLLAEAAQPTGGVDELTPFLGGEVALVVTSLALAEELGEPVAGIDLDLATPSPGLATPSPDQPAPTGAAVILRAADRPGAPDAAFAKAEELLEQEAADLGASVDETTHGGVSISTVAETGGEGGTALARVDDFLLFAETAADLAPIIDTSAGAIPPLAEDDAFERVRRALPNDFLLYGFANGAGVAPALQASFEQDVGVPAGDAFAAVAAQAGFSLWADDPGFRIDTVSIPSDAATPGAANFEPRLDEQVPSDALLFLSGFDLGRSPLLDFLGLLVAQGIAESISSPFEGDPPADEATDPHEAAAGLLTFNLRDDFLRQMVGEFALALSATSADLDGIDAVLVSGVEDEARLNDALSKIAFFVNAGIQDQGLDGSVRTEETAGSLTHRVTAALPDLGGLIRAGFGIVDGQFVLGYGRGFDDFVAGTTNSLATDPTYRAVMSTLPAEHNAAVYLDLGQLIPLLRPLIETPGTEGLPSDVGPGTPTAADELAAADLSAIQAYAAVGFEEDGLRHGRAILFIEEP